MFRKQMDLINLYFCAHSPFFFRSLGSRYLTSSVACLELATILTFSYLNVGDSSWLCTKYLISFCCLALVIYAMNICSYGL